MPVTGASVVAVVAPELVAVLMPPELGHSVTRPFRTVTRAQVSVGFSSSLISRRGSVSRQHVPAAPTGKFGAGDGSRTRDIEPTGFSLEGREA
jgi:hypothetical protein